jgi:hypothetical protein
MVRFLDRQTNKPAGEGGGADIGGKRGQVKMTVCMERGGG